MCLNHILRHKLLNLRQRECFFQFKNTDSCPQQRLHCTEAAKLFSDVVAKCPDIGSLRAGHIYGKCAFLRYKIYQLQCIDRNRPCLALDRLSLSCKLIELLSIHLQCRIHRRNLKLIPGKATKNLLQSFPRHPGAVRCLQNLPRHVLCIR